MADSASPVELPAGIHIIWSSGGRTSSSLDVELPLHVICFIIWKIFESFHRPFEGLATCELRNRLLDHLSHPPAQRLSDTLPEPRLQVFVSRGRGPPPAETTFLAL